jgi:ABC-2 type transport system ATP-binding protein
VTRPRSVLEVSKLSVTYGTKVAVHDVTLKVIRGEIFGLLGPNGAGKTSTLSAIEGLVKPKSETVLLEGVDVARHPQQAGPLLYEGDAGGAKPVLRCWHG